MSIASLGDLVELNLAKHRRIYLSGEINEETSGQTLELLHYYSDLSLDPIFIFINSQGGSCDDMNLIIDQMELCQAQGIEIWTIAQNAFSAAANILAYGSPGHRYILKNGNAMFHPVSYSLNQDYGNFQDKVTKFIKEKEAQEVINLAFRLGKDVKRLKKQIETSVWLTGRQAVDFGVVDAIWTHNEEKMIREYADNRAKPSVQPSDLASFVLPPVSLV